MRTLKIPSRGQLGRCQLTFSATKHVWGRQKSLLHSNLKRVLSEFYLNSQIPFFLASPSFLLQIKLKSEAQILCKLNIHFPCNVEKT